jgi:DNA-binding transcriptional MerR regulator
MPMGPRSTKEVARELGIARSTLELWIQKGKVKPKTVTVGKLQYRLWTEREVDKIRRVKEKSYRKGRGRKKKPKA